MIQRQLKLKLTVRQEATLNSWLWILTGLCNWVLRKIELDAREGVYHSRYDLEALVTGHSKRLGVPREVLEATIRAARDSWVRCFEKTGGRPRLKGQRNKLNSIPFKKKIPAPGKNRIRVSGVGAVRFHKQELPDGVIKCGRIIKRASGWYFCLFIDAEPNVIPKIADGEVGIDPGFSSLLTLSTGEKIEHPRELEASAKRLAQAQRGKNRHLAARISERIANQRKDRNHKISRRLVSENQTIVFSADNHSAIKRKFGKSVTSSGHAQLRQMLKYKSSSCGREYIEVNPRFSTVTCSTCHSRSGPTGLAGLKVRTWKCSVCGSTLDRDINAAVNTLRAGVGLTHEGGESLIRNSSERRMVNGATHHRGR